MSSNIRKLSLTIATLAIAVCAGASESILQERSEMMKGVRTATKPVGEMLRGDAEFDAATLQESLAVYADASARLGDLVPPGSEGGKAASAIWEDPDGFAAEIQKWQEAVDAAIEANPQDLAAARPVVSPILQSCKSCHDGYRIEDD